MTFASINIERNGEIAKLYPLIFFPEDLWIVVIEFKKDWKETFFID